MAELPPGLSPKFLEDIPVDPTFQNIMGTLKGVSAVPGLSQFGLPQVQDILSPEKTQQYLSPAISALREGTESGVASTVTEMQKRGLTGSDIEASAIAQTRAEGQRVIAELIGKTNLQNMSQLAQFTFQAAQGGIADQRENLVLLAQAMGQELTSQRDIEMFQQQLKDNIEQARKNHKAGLWSSAIGAIGKLGGAVGEAVVAAYGVKKV